MNKSWKKSKKGLISTMYDNQVARSKRKGFASPSYSKKWLHGFLLSNPEYHRLYDIWATSGYKRDLVPSIDRIDNYVGYTEYNIQLMSWNDNNKKGYCDRISGKNKKMLKPIARYNKDNLYIDEFYSCREASRQTGVKPTSIANCLSGLSKSAGGYIWKYIDLKSEREG